MTITGDRRGLEEADMEMFVLLLPHSLCYSLPLCLTVVSISHLNQVFTLPSVVIQSPWQPWQPWATEQREHTVGCSPSPNVSIWTCSLSRSRFSSHLPPCVVLYTHPSISHSFVSFIRLSVCPSVCQETILQHVVESWQSRLSCGVPSCQTYQSRAPAYMPFSDDDKSAQLV